MTRRGYTLVEVLVVVGIIIALAAILFPVFRAARENGRMAKCTSNLHQWGLAIQMYRQEWDGIDPEPGKKVTSLYALGLPPIEHGNAWEKQYHLDLTDVHFCPSAPSQRTEPYPYGTYFWATDDPTDQTLFYIEQRGMSYPLMSCTSHNPLPHIWENPTWAIVRVLCLRFDQRVDSKKVRAWGVPSHLW